MSVGLNNCLSVKHTIPNARDSKVSLVARLEITFVILVIPWNILTYLCLELVQQIGILGRGEPR